MWLRVLATVVVAAAVGLSLVLLRNRFEWTGALSDAAIALVPAIVTLLVSELQFQQRLQHDRDEGEKGRRHDLRMATFVDDRERLRTADEFVGRLWTFAVSDEDDAAIVEAQDWWAENKSLLPREVDEAFRHWLNASLTHKQLLAGHFPADQVRENAEVHRKALEVIRNALEDLSD